MPSQLIGAEVCQPQSLFHKGQRILLTVGLPFGARIIAPRFAFLIAHPLTELHQLLGKRLFSQTHATKF